MDSWRAWSINWEKRPVLEARSIEGSAPGFGAQHRVNVQRARFVLRMGAPLVNHPLNRVDDLRETDASRQECRHTLLVGRVEHRREARAGRADRSGQGHGGEGILV